MRRHREMKKLLNKFQHSQTAQAALISASIFVFILAAGVFFIAESDSASAAASVPETMNAETAAEGADSTPPQITLHYDSSYRPAWLDGYEEEGYSAVDGHDGDITSSVEVTRENGVIIYEVTDAAGNRAQAERRPDYSVAAPVLTPKRLYFVYE